MTTRIRIAAILLLSSQLCAASPAEGPFDSLASGATKILGVLQDLPGIVEKIQDSAERVQLRNRLRELNVSATRVIELKQSFVKSLRYEDTLDGNTKIVLTPSGTKSLDQLRKAVLKMGSDFGPVRDQLQLQLSSPDEVENELLKDLEARQYIVGRIFEGGSASTRVQATKQLNKCVEIMKKARAKIRAAIKKLE